MHVKCTAVSREFIHFNRGVRYRNSSTRSTLQFYRIKQLSQLTQLFESYFESKKYNWGGPGYFYLQTVKSQSESFMNLAK